MNIIAISKGGLVIYWSSIVIALGAAAGLALALALCRDRKCSKAAVFAFFPFAFLFSVILGRAMHWYFVTENYASFGAAMTDFTAGGFCVTAVLFSSLLAAAIVRALRLAEFKNLLDTVTPGVVLTIAFVRLAAMFGNTCHSKIVINSKLFQFLPFAAASTDAAGNTVYKFASFFMGFVLLLFAAAYGADFFAKHRDAEMTPGAGSSGNAARLTLAMACCIEIIMDSTRSDATMLHFMLLKMINKYVSFISVTMIICAFVLLFIFIHYIKYSFRENGKTAVNFALIGGFVLSVAGIGALEYLAQRFTSIQALRLGQAAFAVLMFLVEYWAYKCCVIEYEEL